MDSGLPTTRSHRDTCFDQGKADGLARRTQLFGKSSKRHALAVEAGSIRNLVRCQGLPAQPDTVVSQDFEHCRLTKAVAIHKDGGGVTLSVVSNKLEDGCVPEALSNVARLQDLNLRPLGLWLTLCTFENLRELFQGLLRIRHLGVPSYKVNQVIITRTSDLWVGFLITKLAIVKPCMISLII